MNPITRYQFIPLAEVLCCVIADMNTAHELVTQESLMEQLGKHYPGLATPSPDILYTTLGTLIKERKIYHTGEGYFVVTPQTYFVAKTAHRENRSVLLEDHPSLSPPVTYLVSMESPAELTKGNTAPMTHCKFCHCFSGLGSPGTQGQPSPGEGHGRGQKGIGDSKPSVRNQAVSTSEESPLAEVPKSLPPTKEKEKEKGRKFGLRLLWRNMSRKEKPKKEYGTFSAQFPPEEWPVRDEENLDNIPRDVEHEIIRRINPVLTVDNLIRHTVLMQKYEERKKYLSQGTSTELLATRHKHVSKGGGGKRQSRPAKLHRRGQTGRERRANGSRRGSPGSEPRLGRAKDPQPLAARAGPGTPHGATAAKPLWEDCPGPRSPVIRKKQIDHPFWSLPPSGNTFPKRLPGERAPHSKSGRLGKRERTCQRSGSLDSPRTFGGAAQQLGPKQRRGKTKSKESPYAQKSPVQPAGDGFDVGPPDPPPRGSRRAGDRCRLCGEGPSERAPYPGRSQKTLAGIQRETLSRADSTGEVGGEAQRQLLDPQGSQSWDQAASAQRLVEKTTRQLQNLGLGDGPGGPVHARPLRDVENELRGKTPANCPEAAGLENEGLTDEDDDDQTLYQQDVEDNDDVCSSLYLEEEEEEEEGSSENNELCRMLTGHIPFSLADASQWNQAASRHGAGASPGPWSNGRSLANFNPVRFGLESRLREGNGGLGPAGSLINPDGGQKAGLAGENRGLHPKPQLGFNNCGGEAGTAERVQASGIAGGGRFDYYNTSEADTEALQTSASDVGEKSACWSASPPDEETRKHFTQKLELFDTAHSPILVQSIRREQNHLEGTENHSITGDSGIDSPRLTGRTALSKSDTDMIF
ncbi:storkhead-box protein 1 isoform X1 [Ornithorhynchus anatinus]|uniref:storkhead-box protein 1 isoform X1 n=1 Tax=Ornithorhynchus anatinus TaxID=9258 RepID=UPI0019D42380|nr:storkhead-box protein 1 isoform X1 [Ornithorhynchus anatinus]